MTDRLDHEWEANTGTGMVRCEACRLIVRAQTAVTLDEECPSRLRTALDQQVATGLAIEGRILELKHRVDAIDQALGRM